mmetsp:Transcript_56777/g.139619  ORF Transcript_56777/g.139619 Transcript_56777/m.139619 type:complete len:334 (-) Transcript_56777:1208-2209(-)
MSRLGSGRTRTPNRASSSIEFERERSISFSLRKRVVAETPADRLREFRKICRVNERNDLLTMYRPLQLEYLLSKQRPDVVFRRMEDAEFEFNKLWSLDMWSADDEIRTVMRTGAMIVRGQDESKRPILWLNEALLGDLVRKTDLCALYHVWMHSVAMMRRSPGVRSYTFVVYERDRKPLATNVEGFRKMADLVRKIFLPKIPFERCVVVSPKFGTKLLLRTLTTFARKLLTRIEYTDDKDIAFRISTRPNDVPDYFVAGRGTPVEVNKDTVGDFENHFFSGQRLSMADVFNSPAPVARTQSPDVPPLISAQSRQTESGSSCVNSVDVQGEELG